MADELRAVEIGGQRIWVEVSDLPVVANHSTPNTMPRSGSSVRTSSAGATNALTANIEKIDITKTLAAIVGPVHSAMGAVGADEVTLEVSLGIKGEVGVFVARSEGNASIKVTAKWKQPAKAA